MTAGTAGGANLRFPSLLAGFNAAELTLTTLTIAPFIIVFQAYWQRIYAAKDEATAVRGVSFDIFLTTIILIVPFFIGILARQFIPADTNPDMVFAKMIAEHMPTGLGVIAVTGLAAALMSGGDSYIMAGAASLVKDLYQQPDNRNISDREIFHVSRSSVLLVSLLALALGLAYGAEGIIPVVFLIFRTLGAALVIPFLALMFWNWATGPGVVAGMLAGGITTACVHFILGQPVICGLAGYIASLTALLLFSFKGRQDVTEQVPALFAYRKIMD